MNNQISAFEYVSILVSIILGLGITQVLSSLSGLLVHFRKVRFYWPHLIWVLFILFLHVQDWFITYQLKNEQVWRLGELMFVLLYPINLYMVARVLLPDNAQEENTDMQRFYRQQYPMIFLLVGTSAFISILFNVLLLQESFLHQVPQSLLLVAMIYFSLKKPRAEILHQSIAVIIAVATLISIIYERNAWVIQ